MRNHGTAPLCELVDVRYRNGVIDRGIKTSARRWSRNDPAYPPDCAWDIEHWQPAKP